MVIGDRVFIGTNAVINMGVGGVPAVPIGEVELSDPADPRFTS